MMQFFPLTIQNDVASEFSKLLRDGARMREVEHVLAKYLSKTRRVMIFDNDGNCFVYKHGSEPSTLFTSSSYTACLEFALNLPIVQPEPTSEVKP